MRAGKAASCILRMNMQKAISCLNRREASIRVGLQKRFYIRRRKKILDNQPVAF
jgi:hypothetical protein